MKRPIQLLLASSLVAAMSALPSILGGERAPRSSEPSVSPYQGLEDPRWPAYSAKRKQDPKIDWKTPISFYGKAIDDRGLPLPGAQIDFVWTDLSPNGSSRVRKESDAEGKFALTGKHGKRLVVEVTKPGYDSHVAGNRAEFEFAGFWEPSFYEPVVSEPVIFKLRRIGQAEPMVHRGPALFSVPLGGEAVYFDVIHLRKAESPASHLRVRLIRDQKVGHRFDWRWIVEAVNGAGLIEIGKEVSMTAPVAGYAPSWTFSVQANDPQFTADRAAKFYLKTGDGKFARLDLRIFPKYQEGAAVELEVFLNPSGSANLEYDAKNEAP